MKDPPYEAVERALAETRRLLGEMSDGTRACRDLIRTSDEALNESRELLFETERLLRR